MPRSRRTEDDAVGVRPVRKCFAGTRPIRVEFTRAGETRVSAAAAMHLRFHVDAETQQPHIYAHGVTEEEVKEVLSSKGDDFRGRNDSRNCFGQTLAGRYLKVIYVPDEIGDGVFVVTAYDLRGNELKAYRRRKRRKRR